MSQEQHPDKRGSLADRLERDLKLPPEDYQFEFRCAHTLHDFEWLEIIKALRASTPSHVGPIQESWEGHGNHERHFAPSTTPQKPQETISAPGLSSDTELLKMALGNTAACLGDALAIFNRVAGYAAFANSAASATPCSADAARLEWLFSKLNDEEIKANIDLVSDAYAMGGLTGIRIGDFRAAIDQAKRRADGGKQTCPYCTSDNEAIRNTYYDQTCEGCVKRMGQP